MRMLLGALLLSAALCVCAENCTTYTTCSGADMFPSLTDTNCTGACDDTQCCDACSTLFRGDGDGAECGSCDSTHFGSATGNSVCSACATSCSASEYLDSSGCGGGTADNSCLDCSSLFRVNGDGTTCGACDASHWRAGDGGSSANTLCLACTTTCSGGGTPSGTCGGGVSNAECVEDCPAPPNVTIANSDGSHTSCGTLTNGSSCVVTCNRGYTASGVFTCKEGEWSAAPTCDPDPCPPLPNGGSGSSQYVSACADETRLTPSGGVCALECSKLGYAGVVEHECTAGQWNSLSAPDCKASKREAAADSARLARGQAQLSLNAAKEKASKYINDDAGMVGLAAFCIFMFTNIVYCIGGRIDSAEARSRKEQQEMARNGEEGVELTG